MGRQTLEELDLEALETAIRRQALRLAGRAVEQRINADHSDGGSTHLPCECGQMTRYAGRREKTFQSALGPLKLERAYYYCAACGHGFCPRDRQLVLQDTSLSPAITRMVAAVGALVSFEEGSQLLEELAGVSVNAKQVERAAEALGMQISEDEKRDVLPSDLQPLPSTLYLGVDGTGVPMRAEELKGRGGKQSDGSAKTREVKLCTVWSAEGRDAEDRPVRDEGSVSYTAALESAATLDVDEEPSAFTQRVLREASRRRFTQAERMVVLGDGAPWIWKIAQELFPGAVQIVDRFHVKQTLSTVSKALYGVDSPQAHQWARRRHEELDAAGLPIYCEPYVATPPVPTTPEVLSISTPQPRPHALSLLPCARSMYFQRSGRSRVQGSRGDPSQTRRHALDTARFKRHHRASLLSPQRPFSGFLGASHGVKETGVILLHLTFLSCALGNAAGELIDLCLRSGSIWRTDSAHANPLCNQLSFHGCALWDRWQTRY